MSGLILPIDKPAGWTSFDVVAKLRGGLKWKKVGHAGTLDPAATGMLIVLFGDCTSASDEFMALGKSYRGTIRLGITTDSDDLDGKVLGEQIVNWDIEKITEFFDMQQGEVMQRPPAVSAIKVEGKRSYRQVRHGKTVELEARAVRIDRMNIVRLENPEITFDMDCSKGTYVRSIARDLGELLGCGGALAALRRTRIGSYSVDNAWVIEEALKHPEFKGA